MTAPFDRWRASYRHRPGQLPTREKLDSLAPDEIVGVRADILLQLVVQAENHEAPCEHSTGADDGASDAPRSPLAAPLADFAYRERVPARPDRLTGATGGFYREGMEGL